MTDPKETENSNESNKQSEQQNTSEQKSIEERISNLTTGETLTAFNKHDKEENKKSENDK